MFFWKKKKNTEPVDLSWIGTDLHSHLIPGIDDGAEDIATSVELVKGLEALGYKKLITTPHVLWEIYPNTTSIITQGHQQLQQALTEAGITIELKAAAEYFIDDYFEEQLRKKVTFLPISGNMVLVEYSMITLPFDLNNVLFEMQIQNYQPLIAHPERYIYLANNKGFFDELKNNGCLFQLNLLSLTGYYGAAVKELAEYLVKKDYYSYVGTDLHGQRHLAGLQKLNASASYQLLKDSGTIKNHLL